MTTLQNRSWMYRFRRSIGFCVVFWMLVIGFAAAPQPVYAQKATIDGLNIGIDMTTFTIKIGEFSIQLGLLGEIVSLLVSIYKLTQELFGALFDYISKIAKIIIEGQKAQVEVKKRLTQALIDRDTARVRTQAKIEAVQDNPGSKTEYLCKATLIHELSKTTGDFQAATSRLAQKAIESMYRGPYDNGDGPQFALDAHRLRCAHKFGSPIDGYPDSCVDQTTGANVEPFKRLITDADISPFTLDGAVPLEIPVFVATSVQIDTNRSITVIRPDPQNYNQTMWVAGLQYCFNIAGPRPTPASGEAMRTEAGKRTRTIFNQGLAMQSAAIKKCTDLLAYHTRPNSDSSMKSLRDSQNLKCSALKGEGGADGIFSAATIEQKFGNCTQGLTPYQAEYIEHALCKSPNHYLAQALDGSNHFKMTDATIQCGSAWNSWMFNVVTKHGLLVDSVLGQQEVKKVWSKMKPKASRMSEAGEATGYEFVTDVAPVKPQPPLSATKVQKIRAGNDHNNPSSQGAPVYFDERPFPEAVMQ